MKNLRLILPSLALAALTASGCWLVSGQFTVSIDLATPMNVDSGANIVVGAQIDLNTEKDYKDHKSNLKGIVDCALLGKITNTGTGSVNVVVYLTPALTPHTTPAQLTADATKTQLWGPLALAAGASKVIGWDESAALFTKAGKAALLSEVKGDGAFTIYAVGATAPYKLRLENGVAVIVIDAAK